VTVGGPQLGLKVKDVRRLVMGSTYYILAFTVSAPRSERGVRELTNQAGS
jgi:hypothetical protein